MRGWWLVAVLAVETYVLRLVGAVGFRRLRRDGGRLELLGQAAPAVLGGLVAIATFGDGATLTLDARAAGVAAAAAAVLLRAPTLVVVGVAVLVTAVLRAL